MSTLDVLYAWTYPAVDMGAELLVNLFLEIGHTPGLSSASVVVRLTLRSW